MNPIEDLLEQMSLREPSSDLDRRISEIPAGKTERRLLKPVAFWSHVVTAAACLIIGVIIGRVVGQIDRQPEERPVFGGSSAPALPMDPGRDPVPSKTQLGSESLVLFNGRPARTFSAVTHRNIRTVDDKTGQQRTVRIPLPRVVTTQSFGI